MGAENAVDTITPIPSVLIIGGNGFLGQKLPSFIAKRHPKCKISLLDIAAESKSEYPYFRADITDLTSLVKILQDVKPEVVIHSASPPIPTSGKGDQNLFVRVNVDG